MFWPIQNIYFLKAHDGHYPPELRKVNSFTAIKSVNCPDNSEIVWKIHKLSKQSKNGPDNPKTVWTIQKLSGQFRNYLDNLETVQTRGDQIVF